MDAMFDFFLMVMVGSLATMTLAATIIGIVFGVVFLRQVLQESSR